MMDGCGGKKRECLEIQKGLNFLLVLSRICYVGPLDQGVSPYGW